VVTKLKIWGRHNTSLLINFALQIFSLDKAVGCRRAYVCCMLVAFCAWCRASAIASSSTTTVSIRKGSIWGSFHVKVFKDWNCFMFLYTVIRILNHYRVRKSCKSARNSQSSLFPSEHINSQQTSWRENSKLQTLRGKSWKLFKKRSRLLVR